MTRRQFLPITGLGFPLILLGGGCTDPVPEDMAATLKGLPPASSRPPPDTRAPYDDQADLGRQLSDGSPLRHRFRFTNTEPRPLRILAVSAQRPCCSSVLAAPRHLDPGAVGYVDVEYRGAGEPGLRRVEFSLRTDSQHHPTRRFALVVDLRPDFIFDDPGQLAVRLRLGEGASSRHRIQSRRIGQTGREAPTRVEATTGLKARFISPVLEQTTPEGWSISSRDVEVALLPQKECGLKSGTLRFLWDDGVVRQVPLHWEVVPRIRALPSAIILETGETAPSSRTVRLVSSGPPFQVLGSGDHPGLSVSFDPQARQTAHTVTLQFEPSFVQAHGLTDVVLKTDDPEQPGLRVSVYCRK